MPGFTGVAAERIDVDAAAPQEVAANHQALAAAALLEVEEDLLDGVLVETLVAPERHEVFEQTGLVDGGAMITHEHRRPVRLPRHRAQGAEQVGVQLFLRYLAVLGSRQELIAAFVGVDREHLIIETRPLESTVQARQLPTVLGSRENPDTGATVGFLGMAPSVMSESISVLQAGGIAVQAVLPSPLRGKGGNEEFLLLAGRAD